MVTPKKNRDGTEVMKEQLVNDYNRHMGYVDLNDSVIGQHSMVRKSHKWTTKLAFHLIEECLFNAHVLYCLSETVPQLTFLDFKLELVSRIFEQVPCYQSLSGIVPSNIEQHFPEKVLVKNPK